MGKKIVIFGAGRFGRLALNKNRERVAYFIDNNSELHGKEVDGFLIKSVEEFISEKGQYIVLIACKSQETIKNQLEQLGITDYECYLETVPAYYPTNELVYNPYENERDRDVLEDKANDIAYNSYKRQQIHDEVEKLYGKDMLFTHVEIETINRCNGNCDFCPVSKQHDTREYCEMSDDLFRKIIDELSELDYRGKLALFSNNEPLLDGKIIERHQYAREKLPNARMHLFTNGTLLTVEVFRQLMLYLDELIIDNYQQELNLIRPCQEIVRYCEDHPKLKERVTIVLRRPHEILSSRGGDAPNRNQLISLEGVRCVLPYTQMIIRPDGKVSLCCNDALGRNTLGDVSKNSLLDVWRNEHFQMVRDCLYRGRENWEHCKYCDFLSLG